MVMEWFKGAWLGRQPTGFTGEPEIFRRLKGWSRNLRNPVETDLFNLPRIIRPHRARREDIGPLQYKRSGVQGKCHYECVGFIADRKRRNRIELELDHQPGRIDNLGCVRGQGERSRARNRVPQYCLGIELVRLEGWIDAESPTIARMTQVHQQITSCRIVVERCVKVYLLPAPEKLWIGARRTCGTWGDIVSGAKDERFIITNVRGEGGAQIVRGLE